jgi:hypothetical protein
MRVTSKTYFISGGHNFESHRALAKELDKLGGSMSDGIGCYQGIAEPVWLICHTDPTVEKDIINLAKSFDQTCVLVVYGDNQDAELIFTSGDRKPIGKMVCLGPDEGNLRGRDYTYVNGNFYVAET